MTHRHVVTFIAEDDIRLPEDPSWLTRRIEAQDCCPFSVIAEHINGPAILPPSWRVTFMHTEDCPYAKNVEPIPDS